VPALTGIGLDDYMVVSNYNISASYYKPIYEGDIVYTITERSDFKDITPEQGSFYNQKGELVGEGAGIRMESFRRHKDPAKREPSGTGFVWESPNWWTRPTHIYTDVDWEEIKNIWKNEKIRGSKTLYWDDVNIGDEPSPIAVGPLLADEGAGAMLGLQTPVPQWSVDTKLSMLDPKTFSKMVKNEKCWDQIFNLYKWGIFPA
jgi:hypothetical protein